ncbi:MAG: CoA transferase, partial [Burkholderiales bacterium]
RQTGRGCDVDTCLFDVALHQLSYAATWYLNEGEVSTRLPRSAHLAVAPVQTFPTADGWIFVMCMTDKFWSALLQGISRPDLASDPRFASRAARFAHREALTQVLDAVFRGQPSSYWLSRLSGLLPVAPIHDLRQALENPFVARTGMVRSTPHPDRPDFKVLASPVRIDGERAVPAVCPPLDADRKSLLA